MLKRKKGDFYVHTNYYFSSSYFVCLQANNFNSLRIRILWIYEYYYISEKNVLLLIKLYEDMNNNTIIHSISKNVLLLNSMSTNTDWKYPFRILKLRSLRGNFIRTKETWWHLTSGRKLMSNNALHYFSMAVQKLIYTDWHLSWVSVRLPNLTRPWNTHTTTF